MIIDNLCLKDTKICRSNRHYVFESLNRKINFMKSEFQILTLSLYTSVKTPSTGSSPDLSYKGSQKTATKDQVF